MGDLFRCPNCGAILKKGMSPRPTGRVVGTATCVQCRATFSQTAVYDGQYDVDESRQWDPLSGLNLPIANYRRSSSIRGLIDQYLPLADELSIPNERLMIRGRLARLAGVLLLLVAILATIMIPGTYGYMKGLGDVLEAVALIFFLFAASYVLVRWGGRQEQ